MNRSMLSALTLILSGCNAAQGDEARLPPKPEKKVRPVALAHSVAEDGGAVHANVGRTSLLVGKTQPHRSSAVSVPGGAGLIQRVFVKEGEFVRAGQIVARLDDATAKLRLEQAEAGLRGAEAQMKAAERELKRITKLAKDNAVAQSDLDKLTTGHEAAAAGLAAAKVGVASAKKAVEDTQIRAPFGGLVTRRLKSEGEWVSTMPPAPVIQLEDITPLDLTVQAAEHMLTKVAVGDRVTARFPALGTSVQASVTRIVPSVNQSTRTFTIIAEIPNEDRALQAGLFAEVSIESNEGATQ